MMTEGKTHTHADLKLWVKEKYAPAHERIVKLEEKHEASIQALKIQAKEYERRLSELNHAATRRELRDAHFVSNDAYDGYRESVETKFDKINESLAELRGQSAGSVNVRHLVFETITIIIAIVALYMAFGN